MPYDNLNGLLDSVKEGFAMAHALEIHFTAYNNARVQYSKPEMRWGDESPEEAGNIIVGQPKKRASRKDKGTGWWHGRDKKTE